jgi:hypothetical protein
MTVQCIRQAVTDQLSDTSIVKMVKSLLPQGLKRNICLMQVRLFRYGLYLAFSVTVMNNEPFIAVRRLKVCTMVDQR